MSRPRTGNLRRITLGRVARGRLRGITPGRVAALGRVAGGGGSLRTRPCRFPRPRGERSLGPPEVARLIAADALQQLLRVFRRPLREKLSVERAGELSVAPDRL